MCSSLTCIVQGWIVPLIFMYEISNMFLFFLYRYFHSRFCDILLLEISSAKLRQFDLSSCLLLSFDPNGALRCRCLAGRSFYFKPSKEKHFQNILMWRSIASEFTTKNRWRNSFFEDIRAEQTLREALILLSLQAVPLSFHDVSFTHILDPFCNDIDGDMYITCDAASASLNTEKENKC